MNTTNNGSQANNNTIESALTERLRQIVNAGGLNAFMDDNHMIEELHNSQNRGVRFYEIPLNPQQQRNLDERRQTPFGRETTTHAQRIRERAAIYQPGNTMIWRDRRSRDAQQPATPVVTIQATIHVDDSRQHTANREAERERLRQREAERRRQRELDTERELERQRIIDENVRQMQAYRQEENERKERAHHARIAEMLDMLRTYSPNHSHLFSRVIHTVRHLRLACEIDDACYSCSFSNHDYGVARIIEIVDPCLHTTLQATYHNGNPTYQTNQAIMASGILLNYNREVSNVIFDFASLIKQIYCENANDRLNAPTPIFVQIDEHDNVSFNGDHIVTLSRHHDIHNGLIYLTHLRPEGNEAVFRNEKAILKALNAECWYAVVNILRRKFRMFNTIPDIKPKIRRTNSMDQISPIAPTESVHTTTLNDGRPDEEYIPTVIRYSAFPFNREPRDIQITRPRLTVTAYNINNDKLVMKHARPHFRHLTLRDRVRRVDHRDHDVASYHDNYTPSANYVPINVGRYIANNNVDYNLSEDDGDYRY